MIEKNVLLLAVEDIRKHCVLYPAKHSNGNWADLGFIAFANNLNTRDVKLWQSIPIEYRVALEAAKDSENSHRFEYNIPLFPNSLNRKNIKTIMECEASDVILEHSLMLVEEETNSKMSQDVSILVRRTLRFFKELGSPDNYKYEIHNRVVNKGTLFDCLPHLVEQPLAKEEVVENILSTISRKTSDEFSIVDLGHFLVALYRQAKAGYRYKNISGWVNSSTVWRDYLFFKENTSINTYSATVYYMIVPELIAVLESDSE